MADRAILFIDGNNWYHGLRSLRIPNLIDLDYAAISEKLSGPREWVGTRYYIGALKQAWNPIDYANQRKFLSLIRRDDTRISVHLGRLEERETSNPLAEQIIDLLRRQHGNMDKAVFDELRELAEGNETVVTLKEKAVDVHLAIDMHRLAVEDAYDAAYILSADGDYTPAVKAVKAQGKTVYAASPLQCAALAQCVRSYIRLRRDWFDDCYRGRHPGEYALEGEPRFL